MLARGDARRRVYAFRATVVLHLNQPFLRACRCFTCGSLLVLAAPGCQRLPSRVNTAHQFGRQNLKSVGDSRDVVERYVSLAAFDRADVSRMQLRSLGQAFLRELARLPQSPHCCAKRYLRFLFGGRFGEGPVHALSLATLRL
jgi:hypothetical protein